MQQLHIRKFEEGIIMDEIDEDILLLISQGHTFSYSIWKVMQTKGDNSMAYNNVNRRVVLLEEDGLIEADTNKKQNIHGRKDYKITKKGKEVIRQHIHKLEQILSS